MEERVWPVAMSHLGSEPECGSYSPSELLRLAVTVDS